MKPTRLLRALLAVATVVASQSCTVKQSETPDLLGPSSLTTPPPPAPPTAQFVFSPSAPALSTPVAFDGRPSCPEAGFAGFCVISDRTITAYNWDFGDGTTGSGAVVSHVYRTLGSFVVSLTVVSDRGLSSTASRSVPIGVGGTPPTAGFVFSPTNPTIGQSVSFNAATSKGGTTGIANYSWDFGDGGRAGGVNPTHAFNTAGTYVVLLIVTDEAGQTATTTQSVPVQINSQTPLPTADFVFSPTNATTGQSVSFNASLSKAATGHSIVEYSWNFGNGGTGSGATPSHTFGTAGTYSVVLVVKDDLGQTGTASKTVPVTSTSPSPPPTADFVFSPTNPTIGQSVSFNGSTSKAATGRTITAYSWNFGDGGAPGTGVTPSRAYSTAATFSVVLTVTDDLGQTGVVSKTITVNPTGQTPPPTADFVFSPTNPTIGQSVVFNASASKAATGHSITTYAWNFGDGGAPGTGLTPSRTYNTAATFTVVLTVTDDLGQTGVASKTITVNPTGQTPPPTADFVFSPTNPTIGQSVSFNGSTSKAATGHSITTYSWNFGDGGAPGTGVTPSRTYSTAATFSVVLTVTDDLGQTGVVSKTITVNPTGQTPPPTADFVFSPTNPTIGQSVSFNGSTSKAATGHTITTYSWNFGDGGATGSGVTPSRTFNTAATFTVVLTVTDDLNQTAVASKTVTVSPTGQTPPTAKFTFTPSAPVAGQLVTFNASQSSAGPGRVISSYAWTFGDGTSPASGVSPTHTFAAVGSYSVVLVVTDDIGQTGTVTNTVTVGSSAPKAAFVFSPSTPVVGQPVTFDASSSAAAPGRSIVSYAWTWDDGTSPGGGVNTVHTFGTAKTYNVRLIVTDDIGQTGTVTNPVTVGAAQPEANFVFSPTDPAVGQIVFFDATPSIPSAGQTIISYTWDFGDGFSCLNDGTGCGVGGTPRQPRHAFPGPPTNTWVVRLTIQDSASKSATVTKTITTK